MNLSLPASVAASCALAGTASAIQFVEDDVTILYSIAGEAPGDNFGLELAAVGDYDGDGAKEFLVSAPGNDDGAGNAGKVYLIDGATGAVLRTHAGSRPGEARRNVCDAGDVDGDGVVDYLVGTGDGWVYVYAGASGALLHSLSGGPSEAFGFRACGVGDLDGDGRGEILVGARGNDAGGNDAGRAYVYSGATGTILRQHDWSVAGGNFGHTVALLGDLDGDGVGEYAVAAPGPYSAAAPGEVVVFSGATGAELPPRLTPGATGRVFGAWVPPCSGQDFDGDGVPDFTVTDLGDMGNDRGRLYVYSGATRDLLFQRRGFTVNSGFGGVPPNPASSLGDVNADGVPDILVGSWESASGAANGGRADILSGADGTRMRTVTSDRIGVFLGGSAAGLGFVDADATEDFALGANGDGGSRGVVYVIGGHEAIGARFCTPGVPNSTGRSGQVNVFGSDGVADDDLVLVATQLPPGPDIGYFLMGTGSNTFTPPGSAGPVCIAPGVERFLPPVDDTSDLQGGFRREVGTGGPVSGNIAVGSTWSFQAWHRDSIAGGSNLTDAVRVTFH